MNFNYKIENEDGKYLVLMSHKSDRAGLWTPVSLHDKESEAEELIKNRTTSN